MTSGEAHPETRRMMETATRRLNALEYVILGVAMALALLAGALAAWMVENMIGIPFRPTWGVSSLLFFIVPGWIVLRRERRSGFRGATGAIDAAENTETAEAVDTAAGEITERGDDGGR